MVGGFVGDGVRVLVIAALLPRIQITSAGELFILKALL